MEFRGPLVRGIFLRRPNRFTVLVEIGGVPRTCHLPNPGRLEELLVPGAKVFLREKGEGKRRTGYDLVAVSHQGGLVSVDSRLPNRLVEEALAEGRIPPFRRCHLARGEVSYGRSRFDFLLQCGDRPCLLEVKSCTLVRDGRALFPDAVTDRGRRHGLELARAHQEGYRAAVLFVVQRTDASIFSPNDATDPAFGEALRWAAWQGVEVLAYRCLVTERGVSLEEEVAVDLGGKACR
ncbi:MAG: DNA/RNA nuclease SfsA [Euryarchaeota archaeon]|nr:DNA/RNA nuclease SfsA [Euryarchaeota archaeon]